jgi:hypothetical protein
MMSSSSSLPPNSPAFTPSQSLSSVASSAAPAPSPSYIPSSAPPVSQPQLPVRRNTTAQQPQVQRAVIPERVPMLFNMWLQSLWFAPSEYDRDFGFHILAIAKRGLTNYICFFSIQHFDEYKAVQRRLRDDAVLGFRPTCSNTVPSQC